MKRYLKYFAAAAIAVSVCACSEYEELDNNTYIPAPGETVKLVLNANKGNLNNTQDTRIFVGETGNGKVRYYWNEDDQIGVIPFAITDAKPNYVTQEVSINPSDKNIAQFEAYITGEDYTDAQPKLLVYYPYNSSMLQSTTGTKGEDYASSGLTFRLPQLQEQYGYNRALKGSDPQDVNEHPSVWAVSNYGLAYDLATSVITKDIESGHTDVTATGEFTLDHANTYFQFNVYGTQSQGGKNYADGTWKVATLTIEAGHCEMTTDPTKEETTYTMSNQVPLAGTYKITYNYNAKDFDNVSGVKNNDKITLENKVAQNVVKVNMNNIESAPALKGDAANGVPAFAVVNALDIKNNPTKDLNCLKVSVTCYKYDGDKIVGSDTRTRYYNISSIVGQDIAGNFYSIDFEVCDPVESYTDLSATDTANCYLIGAPGNYTFNANVAGNGKLPYGATGTSMGVNPNQLMQAGKEYAIDWLWASGLSFDDAKSGNMTDEEVVAEIINNVSLAGDKGEISIGLAAGSTLNTLSGNILLALYEVKSDGTAGDIVWTWHLWLGIPQTQHYRFPATNASWVYTNEDWYMMDRNLGAETNELNNPRSTGLFYQRSRKEPMISFGNRLGSTDWTQNQISNYRNVAKFGSRAQWTAGMEYSNYNTLKYPMAMITDIPSQAKPDATGHNNDYYYGWNSSKSDENDIANDTKSMFDPCPVGYRMPTVREWDNLKADVYYYIKNGVGSGVFGYCHYKDVEMIDPTNYRAVDIAARIAGGDYYTVNENYEREYHIVRNSGTGQPLVTRFPNTGLLRGNGEWAYMSDNSYTTPVETIVYPDGPEVSTEIKKETQEVTTTETYYLTAPSVEVTTDKKASNIKFKFNTAGIYYYSVNDNNSTPSSVFEVNANTEITIYQGNGSASNAIYVNNLYTENKVYFYTKDSESGTYSNPTTLTFSRNSKNNQYSTNVTKGQNKEMYKDVTTTVTSHFLSITFADPAGVYSYAKSSSATPQPIDGASLEIDCASLTYSGSNSSILYLYQTNAKGITSAATTVTVYRTSSNGNYTYTATSIKGAGFTEETGGELVVSSTSTMALWTAGRIDEGSFYTYWFGPGNDVGDGWGEYKKDLPGVTAVERHDNAPYTESRKTYGLTYSPVALKVYDSKSPEWSNDPAVPTRCIREYDNKATQTVAE